MSNVIDFNEVARKRSSNIKKCLVEISTDDGKRHAAYDIGNEMVLCLDQKSCDSPIETNVYPLIDYIYIAASTPYITKKHALKWAL